MAVTVLLIGNTTGKYNELMIALNKKYTLIVASSGKQALLLLRKNPSISLIVLDAISMKTSGARIVTQINQILPRVPIILIQPKGKIQTQNKNDADLIVPGPISQRRLINNIERILHNDDDEILNYGPFTINVTRRILIAHGKESQLTPKQAQLVATFLRNPGKTIGRKYLMEQVWNTDYLGDTRTLDVHIRWVRTLMEEDSKRPCYLKTIRGIGYQLSIPDEKQKTDQ